MGGLTFFSLYVSGGGGLDAWMTFLWVLLSVHTLGRFLMKTWLTRLDFLSLFCEQRVCYEKAVVLRCSLEETKHCKSWFYLINPFTLWIYYGVIISHSSFESVEEILLCYHSNIISLAELLHGVFNFWDFTKGILKLLWFFYIRHHSLPFFIHQNLYFKLIDSSCSLFCATDVAKQSNIRFKEAALLLSSRRATSGLDKGKTSSGGKTEPKTLCFDKSTHACIAADKVHGKQDCHWNLI